MQGLINVDCALRQKEVCTTQMEHNAAVSHDHQGPAVKRHMNQGLGSILQ